MCLTTLLIYKGRTYVSAHRRAHKQVRPYDRFSYFYERNVVLGGHPWVRPP